MVQFTGHLLGKVQLLDGGIRPEVLTSLAETLLQRCQSSSSSSDPTKKLIKFNENNKYAVECTERGLKLTSPNLIKSKDEGFESDCGSVQASTRYIDASDLSDDSDSIRSGKGTERSNNVGPLDLSGLMNFLEISKEKETHGQVSGGTGNVGLGDVESSHNLHHSLSSGASSGGDNTSISSNSNLHAVSCTDDGNSSSGNGSDSDEFCAGDKLWEPLPNVSSFQSYPIDDIIFCHCDTLHATTLVWVIRHLSKMVALVTFFQNRSESSDLFKVYRELRVKLKPVKYGSNANSSSFDDNYITNNGLPRLGRPGTPGSDLDSIPFTSLPVAYPTEILHETQLKSPIFSSTKSLDFDTKLSCGLNLDLKEPVKMNTFGVRSHLTCSSGNASSIPIQNIFSSSHSGSNSFLSHHSLNLMSHDDDEEEADEDDEDEDDTETEEDDVVLPRSTINSLKFNTAPKSFAESFLSQAHGSSIQNKFNSTNNKKLLGGLPPMPPIRSNDGTSSVKAKLSRKTVPNKKPILLVPLKTESVATTRSRYPKESYLYHVGRSSSSTFAPYQRSLNFISTHGGPMHSNGSTSGQDGTLGWSNGRHVQCIPFSSWLEMAEMPKIPHAGTSGGGRKFALHPLKHKANGSNSSSSSLGTLKGTKGTSKILLRDAAGYQHGMWANLSQRFKRNLKDNLMPKLNWMWTPHGQKRPRKKANKEVTFNAWATVQMI